MRVLNLTLNSLLIFLILGNTIHADPIAPPSFSGIYEAAITDLSHDIEEFDGLKLSPEDRAKLSTDWKNFAQTSGTGTNPLTGVVGMDGLWPPKDFSSLITTGPVTHANPLPTDVISGAAHSIPDVDTYVGDRLGPAVAKLLKDKKVSLQVYGGNTESLAKEMSGHLIKRIPSLYENWGVEKFIDLTPGLAKPQIILRVPPIEQYVKHYAMLGSIASGEKTDAKMNELDRIQHKEQFKAEVDKLYSHLDSKPDYVVIGYANTLDAEIKSGKAGWTLEKDPIRVDNPTGDGMGGTLYHVKTADGTTKAILAVDVKQTIWGEGASFLVDGILDQKPEGIAFFGSAGSISQSAKVYDVSVPAVFDLNGDTPVHISNDLDIFHSKTVSDQLKFGGHHGNTNSPAEQTLDKVTSLVNKGIDTIDVEENLIAKEISDYDVKNHTGVTFSAANVITDKPQSHLFHWEGLGLDHSNPALKSAAKNLTIDTFLQGIHLRADWETQADQLRKKLILAAMPNVDPALIKIHNGQGKIDADPKHKLSYYIFTENPLDPKSPTHLIPMATSRFDVNNYQTDDWWDAHQTEIADAKAKGLPMPHQDRNEVRAYLKANGLSTNPDVFTLDLAMNSSSKMPLNDFLLKDYLSRYSDGKYVTLYRGAGKPEELAGWIAKTVPHGVRYWTPDANYGWRYARKDVTFLNSLVTNKAPLFKFKVPLNDFLGMVKDRSLVLGTELTKSVHDSFAATGEFKDPLNNQYYMGDGKYGLEFELRATSRARAKFVSYFVNPITVDELADFRIRQLTDGTNRLVLSHPKEYDKLMADLQKRIARTEQERKVLKLLQTDCPDEEINKALAEVDTSIPAEIASTFGPDLKSFATDFHKDSCSATSILKKMIPPETHP